MSHGDDRAALVSDAEVDASGDDDGVWRLWPDERDTKRGVADSDKRSFGADGRSVDSTTEGSTPSRSVAEGSTLSSPLPQDHDRSPCVEVALAEGVAAV